MKELFKNKSYNLLFAGSLVSEIGNSLFALAMSFYILDVTDSAFSMGLYLFIVMGARVLASPLAGVFVERMNHVRVVYMTDHIRGFLFLGLWIFLMYDPSQNSIFLSLYIIGVLSSLNAAFFAPAVTSALPEIVGEANLQAANGASSIIQSVQNIVGLLLGAIIYSLFGLKFVVLANAISFLLSGISEMFIKAKFKYTDSKRVEGLKDVKIKEEFMQSIHYMKNEKVGLLNMVGYSLILNFAFSPLFAVGMPYLLNNDLARVNAELEYAYLNIAFSIAMLISGIIVGGMKMKSIFNTVMKGLGLLSFSFVIVAILMFLASNRYIEYNTFYILLMITFIFLAFNMILTNVPINTGMLKAVDPEYRGRVFSTVGAISSGAVPISMLIGSIIVEVGNITYLGLFCVVVMMYPLIGYFTNPKVKTLLNSIEGAGNGRLQEAN